MTTELKRHYINRVRKRYLNGSKRVKSLILDEFCEVCGITRNHAIKSLNHEFGERPPRRGPKRKYGKDVDRHLRHLWESMGRINSKKMHAAMPLWLPFYREADDHMKQKLRMISPSSIDEHNCKSGVRVRNLFFLD